jgi:hypothetical protein
VGHVWSETWGFSVFRLPIETAAVARFPIWFIQREESIPFGYCRAVAGCFGVWVPFSCPESWNASLDMVNRTSSVGHSSGGGDSVTSMVTAPESEEKNSNACTARPTTSFS